MNFLFDKFHTVYSLENFAVFCFSCCCHCCCGKINLLPSLKSRLFINMNTCGSGLMNICIYVCVDACVCVQRQSLKSYSPRRRVHYRLLKDFCFAGTIYRHKWLWTNIHTDFSSHLPIQTYLSLFLFVVAVAFVVVLYILREKFSRS